MPGLFRQLKINACSPSKVTKKTAETQPKRRVIHSHPDPDRETQDDSAEEEDSESSSNEEAANDEGKAKPFSLATMTKANFPTLARFYATGLFKPDFVTDDGKYKRRSSHEWMRPHTHAHTANVARTIWDDYVL